MKKETNNTTWVSLVARVAAVILVLHLTGCGGRGNDPAPSSAQDEIKVILTSGKWNLQTALVDGVDKTGTYSALSVTFTSSSYITNNGKGLWPTSGNWSFVGTDGKKIKRDDGTEMVVEATNTSLKLSFSWTKTNLGGGRAESIAGQHVLSFTK